jgi:uncharacterized protein YbjT (DUF2867 family)
MHNIKNGTNIRNDMESRSALIVGATGLVGRYCLNFLLKDPSYSKVNAFVRNELPVKHEKLVQHVVDFNDMDLLGELLTADDVFCCLGTTIRKAGSQEAFRKVDFEYPVKLAAISQHCGAKQFLIVTSLGANPHSKIFYSRVKGEVEEALMKIPFDALHIFRPSLLLGDREEKRGGEQMGSVVMRALKIAMIGPFRKYRAIHASSVAKAMVRVALMNLRGLHTFESHRIEEISERKDT